MTKNGKRRIRKLSNTGILSLVPLLLVSIKLFINAFGILAQASGPAVDDQALKEEIGHLDEEGNLLMSRSFLSPSRIAELPPERVDEAYRDKQLVQQWYGVQGRKTLLEVELRAEQHRQEYVQQKPTAYLFLALGICALGLWCFFIHTFFERHSRKMTGMTPDYRLEPMRKMQ